MPVIALSTFIIYNSHLFREQLYMEWLFYPNFRDEEIEAHGS